MLLGWINYSGRNPYPPKLATCKSAKPSPALLLQMHSHSANICIKIVQLSGDSAPGDCSVVLQWERAPAQANHCFGRRRWGAMSWECGQQTWLQGKRGSPEEPRAEGAGGKKSAFEKANRLSLEKATRRNMNLHSVVQDVTTPAPLESLWKS